MTRGWPLLLAIATASCTSGALEPAPLDTRNEACAACRMAVSEARFAAQIASPGELPRFFDDIGCLASFVKAGRAPADAVAFVSDHQTGAWVRAADALYTRVPGLATPMGSRLVAHATAASRDRDPVARGGAPVPAAELFGPWSGAAGAVR